MGVQHGDRAARSRQETYRERLTPSPGVIAASAVGPIGIAVCFIPLGWIAVVVALVTTTAITAALLNNSSAVVSVGDGPEGPELCAGRARIACALLGPASAHSGDSAYQERGIRRHPRAYMVLRGWVPDLVRVELDDDADPTPYWLISTRNPVGLVAAIEQGRARAMSPEDF